MSDKDKDRGRGTVAAAFRFTYLSWYVAVAHTTFATVFFWYYPWTTDIPFTYFASPSTYGILTTERFVSLQWWLFSLTPLCIPPILLLGFMNNHWLTRWPKLVWIYAVCPFETVLWLLTFIFECIWLAGRNDPANPRNPANSFLACCTPEFYTTVTSCGNYGDPHPECNPSIDLSELGTNGNFVLLFVVTFCMIVVFIMYMALALNILWLTDDYVKYGDPDFMLSPYAFPASATSKGGPSGGSTLMARPLPPPLTGDSQGAPLLSQSQPQLQSAVQSADPLTSRAVAYAVLRERK
jgi:hypothetical protein